MKSSMREIIKDKTTEDLKERKKELYKRILSKQKLINRYRHLIVMAEGNCFEFVREYEMIDRVVFFREERVKCIPSGKTKEKKEEPLIKKDIRLMTKEEQTTLLEQLLKIRGDRQAG